MAATASTPGASNIQSAGWLPKTRRTPSSWPTVDGTEAGASRGRSEPANDEGGRLGRATRGTWGESASATLVPERTNTGLRCADGADGSSGGGATPIRVWSDAE